MSVTHRIAFGAVLALGAISAAAPHAAFALGSTPVTVVNPSLPVTIGNPDDPTAFAKAQNAIRHPFVQSQLCAFGGRSCAVSFDFSTLNPNQRIIVEYVSGGCALPTGVPLQHVELDILGAIVTIPTPDHNGTTSPNLPTADISFGQALLLPLPANTAVNMSADIRGDATIAGTPTECDLSVSGEAIDQ